MKLYLTGRPGERRLSMEREDVLEAVTNGFGRASIEGHLDPMPVIMVGRHGVKLRTCLGPHTTVPVFRITDMHRVVA